MIFFSRDDESFEYDLFGELMDAEELEVGDVYYTADFVLVQPSDIVGVGNVDSLIDDFYETLNDICGESAVDVFHDIDIAERAKLRSVLEGWVEDVFRNHPGRLWRINGKSTEHTITEDDI
jgi:hypothetical protein